MDAESLIPKKERAPQGDTSSSTTTATTSQRRSTIVAFVQFFALSVVLLGSASLGAFFSSSTTVNNTNVPLRQVGELVVVDDYLEDNNNSMDAWSVGKKIHPPHPKKLHHGEVLYKTVQDPTEGRYYQRSFVIPCGYGILVVNIGPANTNMPYDFDVYDDGYAYSNNGGLCIFYPSYKAHQDGSEPFWMPSDPTAFRVPLGDQLTKISTKINDHPHTKDMSKAEKERGGDYLVMTKGDFYTPQYYRELKQMVNTWKASEDGEDNIDEMLQGAIKQLNSKY